MAHHAPVGLEWEIADTAGQTSRPYSGYQFAQRYQNLKSVFAAVPDVSGVLRTVTTTSALWHVAEHLGRYAVTLTSASVPRR